MSLWRAAARHFCKGIHTKGITLTSQQKGAVAMADFLFVYRSSEGAGSRAEFSPEEMQQVMQKWSAWIREAMQKGWMTNPGDALKPEGKVLKSTKVVTDGPFVESKEIVGGYSIVKAASLEAAAELAKGCPALAYGGTVEVRPLAGLASQL
jgi:hypothetical protein